MKTHGEWIMDPHILDLGTTCKWVVSFKPWSFYPWGKSSWCPSYRLGGPQSLSGQQEEPNILWKRYINTSTVFLDIINRPSNKSTAKISFLALLYRVRQANFLFHMAFHIQKRKLACRTCTYSSLISTLFEFHVLVTVCYYLLTLQAISRSILHKNHSTVTKVYFVFPLKQYKKKITFQKHRSTSNLLIYS
jgi:hypothetical protein